MPSQRRREQARLILWLPQLTAREFPGHGREGEPKQNWSLSVLRRQGWERRKAKASIIPRAESLKENYTERELWRSANASLELSTDWCTQMRDHPRQEKELLGGTRPGIISHSHWPEWQDSVLCGTLDAVLRRVLPQYGGKLALDWRYSGLTNLKSKSWKFQTSSKLLHYISGGKTQKYIGDHKISSILLEKSIMSSIEGMCIMYLQRLPSI